VSIIKNPSFHFLIVVSFAFVCHRRRRSAAPLKLRAIRKLRSGLVFAVVLYGSTTRYFIIDYYLYRVGHLCSRNGLCFADRKEVPGKKKRAAASFLIFDDTGETIRFSFRKSRALCDETAVQLTSHLFCRKMAKIDPLQTSYLWLLPNAQQLQRTRAKHLPMPTIAPVFHDLST